MTEQEFVVASVGDRTYAVPKVCTVLIHDTVNDETEGSPRYELSAEVTVVDGQPRYRRLELTCWQPMTAREVQALRWGRIAEAALENCAVDSTGRRAPSDVYASRSTSRRREQKAASRRRTAEGTKVQRSPVSEDRLREVVALRAEAQAKGAPRWDLYAKRKSGYEAGYLRQLASRADRVLGLGEPGDFQAGRVKDPSP